MTVPEVRGQFYPTKEEAKSVYLNALSASAERAGLTVNVLPGSLNDIKADAIASIVVPAYANNKLARQSLSPLECSDDQIVDVAAAYGVIPRPASASSGRLAVSLTSATTTVTIPAGFVATGSDGTKVQTTAVSVVSSGSTVDVQSTTGGSSTNQAAGTQFTWDSATIANLKRTATVDVGGLTLGRDEDSPAIVRQRLLDRLASPGAGGNWSMVKGLAESGSASVSAAFVYPAIGGPGSYGVALVSDETDRQVTSTVINEAAAGIVSALPGHAYLNITATQSQFLDVIVSIKIPLPTSAGGTGGGWRDGTPWPDSTGAIKVTSYDSSTGIATTNAATLTTAAVGSHIGIWNYNTETMHEFEVSSVTLAGTVKISVVGGFPFDPTSMYISAGAENLTGYAATALDAFKNFGPGEKTTNTAIVPRGLRKPVPTATQWPQGITSRFSERWLDSHDEIGDISVTSYDTGTTTPRTSPSVPTSHLDPPYILCPRHIAFRPTA